MEKVAVDHSRCIACAGCVGVCPVDTITLREIVLSIEQGPCISCGLCIQFCPVGALEPSTDYGAKAAPKPTRVVVLDA
jgi:ferredoxin